MKVRSLHNAVDSEIWLPALVLILGTISRLFWQTSSEIIIIGSILGYIVKFLDNVPDSLLNKTTIKLL